MRNRNNLPDTINTAPALVPGFNPKYRLLSETALAGLGGPSWLIKGILPARSFSVVYGAPGEGKTHAVIAMAMALGHGRTCLDRKTASGAVVILAAEGVSGVAQRVRAWRQHHGVAEDDEGQVLFLDKAVQLLDAGEVVDLALSIAHHLNGQGVRLLVIDTLARCFLEGDENAAQDMSRFVQACQVLQNTLGCAVMVIHHQTKSGVGGPRGNGALKGAADTMLHVAKVPGGFQAEIEKQKDGRDNLIIKAHYELVDLGADEDGDPQVVPVAILDSVDEKVEGEAPATAPLGKNQQIALDLLRSAGPAGLDEEEWRDRFDIAGAGGSVKPGRAFREARDGLVQRGLVVADGIRYRLR